MHTCNPQSVGNINGKLISGNIDFEDIYIISLLSIDNIASRYGCLPSEVVARGSTFDLKVLALSIRREEYLHAKASGNDYTQDELHDMVNKAKEHGKKMAIASKLAKAKATKLAKAKAKRIARKKEKKNADN